MHKSKEMNAPPQMQNPSNTTCNEKLLFFLDNTTIKIHMKVQKACHEVYNLPTLSNISQSIYKSYK